MHEFVSAMISIPEIPDIAVITNLRFTKFSVNFRALNPLINAIIQTVINKINPKIPSFHR